MSDLYELNFELQSYSLHTFCLDLTPQMSRFPRFFFRHRDNQWKWIWFRRDAYRLCRARVTKDRQKFCVNDKKNIRIQIIISPFRYNAIIRPLKPRMGRPMTILVAIGIWLVAMTIAVPQLLYFRTIGANDPLLNPGSLDPFDLSVPNITGNRSW